MGDQLEGNIGPLTTTFKGPTTCLATTTYVPDEFRFFHVAGAFTIDNYECYPTGTLHTTGSKDLINMHAPYYYSPGICPSGWQPVVSMEADSPDTAVIQSSDLLPDETTAWLCCPSGFTADNAPSGWGWMYTYRCATTMRPGDTMKNLWIATDKPGQLSDVRITTTISVQANGVPIFWQSTDKVVLDWWKTASPAQTANPSTSTSSRTVRPPFASISDGNSRETTTSDSTESESQSTNTLSSTSDVNPDPQSNQDSPSGKGLSTGAKAGIGAGVGSVAILLGVLMYFILRFRKTRTQMKAMQEQLRTAGPHEVEYNPAGRIVEKQTTANIPEMSTRANIAELPTAWRENKTS